MRKVLALFIVLFLNISAFGSEAVSVKVVHHMGGGRIGSGSGTVIHSEDGKSFILTNKHVAPIDGRYEIVVGERRIPAKWIAAYQHNDLALVSVNEELPVAPVATENPGSNTRVTLFGYPGGGPLRQKIGNFLGRRGSYRGEDGGRILKVNLFPQNGDSGGGIFTDDGVLVAVIWGGGDGPGSAVPLEDIHDFISKYGISFSTLHTPPGYDEVYQQVLDGNSVTFEVKESIPGWPKGVYECWLDFDGQPKMVQK